MKAERASRRRGSQNLKSGCERIGMMLPRGFEARWRDALLDAMIPEPGGGLPPMAAVDRRTFWPRFERSAPWALRLGFRAATYFVGGLAPFLLGHRHVFTGLDAAARDDVLQRVERVPGGAELVLVVKLVACFAYFDDPKVQATVRGTDPP
jgi:hypothetical protein